MIGSDLEALVNNIGWSSENFQWMLLRSPLQNRNIKIRGIIICGKITNKIIGLALDRDVNIIICSDQNIPFDKYPPFNKLYQLLYQHDIYVLQWNYHQFLQTQFGRLLFGKIILADQQYPSTQKEILQYQYDPEIMLKTIFQRFQNVMLQSKNGTIDTTTPVAFISYVDTWTDEIEKTILEQNNNLHTIISTSISQKNHWLLDQGHTLVHIPIVDVLNEISRELYYQIKAGLNIPVFIEFNKSISTMIIRHSADLF